MTEGLKPCPFCPDGGVVVELKKDGEPTGIVAHACYALGIEIRAPKQVWNTRYKRTCKKVPYAPEYGKRTPAVRSVCSECGSRIGERADFCWSCGAEVVDD